MRYGPKQRCTDLVSTSGLLSAYAPLSSVRSKSRATMFPSVSNPVCTRTTAASARVVSIAPSASTATLTGRPVNHDAAAASGSSLVYDFVP